MGVLSIGESTQEQKLLFDCAIEASTNFFTGQRITGDSEDYTAVKNDSSGQSERRHLSSTYRYSSIKMRMTMQGEVKNDPKNSVIDSSREINFSVVQLFPAI